MTDPVADMLARIRTPSRQTFARRYPGLKVEAGDRGILKEEGGYINNFVVKGEGAKKACEAFAL